MTNNMEIPTFTTEHFWDINLSLDVAQCVKCDVLLDSPGWDKPCANLTPERAE
jgi:hypothetical protein